jgi:hypothetical protein
MGPKSYTAMGSANVWWPPKHPDPATRRMAAQLRVRETRAHQRINDGRGECLAAALGRCDAETKPDPLSSLGFLFEDAPAANYFIEAKYGR